MPQFERVHSATNIGLSRFVMWLPILLRAVLLLLALWYGIELLCQATGSWPKVFLVASGLLLLIVFAAIMATTYWRYLRGNEDVPSSTTPLWPFLLVNLLMILLVSAIFKWQRGRGSEDITTGLLGFTWYWVQKIGALFTGGR